MKSELKLLGTLLWKMFVEFITSKKVLTGVLTSGAAILIKDPSTRDHVVQAGTALLLAQGAADFGKSKAALPMTTVETHTEGQDGGSGTTTITTNASTKP